MRGTVLKRCGVLLAAGWLVVSARAELNAEKWMPALAGSKSMLSPGMTNLFYVINPQRQIIAFAGSEEFPNQAGPGKAELAGFYKGYIASNKMNPKEAKPATINGVEAMECKIDMGDTDSLVLLCVSGPRLITLTVLCEKRLGWDDPDVQELVGALGIK